MACDPWFELLSADVDGELGGDQLAALERHVAGCDECRAARARLVDVRRRSLVHAAVATPDLAAGLLARRAAERTSGRVLARRLVAVAAAAVLVLGGGLALWARSGPRVPTDRELALTKVIDAERRAFDSPDIEVPEGSTVEWRNDSTTSHRLVRRLEGSTVATSLAPGQTQSVTFHDPGTYVYYCSIHPGMTGSVQVDA